VPDIIGIDPGLVKTGWGVIRQQGNQLSYIASGLIKPDTKLPLAERLNYLSSKLASFITKHNPISAALEETFVGHNGQSTLKLGQARGALLLTLSQANLSIGEYAPTLIKKAIVGTGRAEKAQMQHMISVLLPGSGALSEDEADALSVAICHSHHMGVADRVSAASMSS
jgi:crossover junction endodeoxyribonuclease RuvC